MPPKLKVVLDRFHHRGEQCIAIRFEKDFYLNSEVKKISGARFSRTNTCWYVVNGKNVLNSILETSPLRVTLSTPIRVTGLRDSYDSVTGTTHWLHAQNLRIASRAIASANEGFPAEASA